MNLTPACRPSTLLPLLLAAALAGASCRQSGDSAPEGGGGQEETSSAMKVDHVDAAGAAALLASENKPVVIDVRTPEEHAEGHIAGCVLADFRSEEFEQKIAELDREQTYLVHCHAGGRSTESLATFEKLGFKHIIHLDGGFSGWEEAGLPKEE